MREKHWQTNLINLTVDLFAILIVVAIFIGMFYGVSLLNNRAETNECIETGKMMGVYSEYNATAGECFVKIGDRMVPLSSIQFYRGEIK